MEAEMLPARPKVAPRPGEVYSLSLVADVAERVEAGVRTAQAVLQALAQLAGDRRQLALADALDLPDPELLRDASLRRALHGIYELEAALGAAYGRAHRQRRPCVRR
jgi:hypothetical protein